MARFLSTFTLLSRLPLRAAFTPDHSRSDFWIPAISPLVSLAAALGAGLAVLAFRDPVLAALGAIALQYLCFNLFHLDGLLDTADAMAVFASREKRLEILKDSRIGSYAFFFGWLALAAKAAALALAFRSGLAAAAAALLAAPLAGRAACALVPLLSPPARPDGLGALMKGFSPRRLALGFLVASLPLLPLALIAGETGPSLLGLGSALLGGGAGGISMTTLYRKRLGGFTGDALGAAVELGELVALLGFAAFLPLLAA
jgi:adenosylcobinamide-GDP ribazoletransferase